MLLNCLCVTVLFILSYFLHVSFFLIWPVFILGAFTCVYSEISKLKIIYFLSIVSQSLMQKAH